MNLSAKHKQRIEALAASNFGVKDIATLLNLPRDVVVKHLRDRRIAATDALEAERRQAAKARQAIVTPPTAAELRAKRLAELSTDKEPYQPASECQKCGQPKHKVALTGIGLCVVCRTLEWVKLQGRPPTYLGADLDRESRQARQLASRY